MEKPGIGRMALLAICVAFGTTLRAQNIVVPATPKGFTVRGAGSGKGGLTAGTSIEAKRPETETKVVQITVVSPRRAWTNTEGKAIQASLAAFSVPKKGEPGFVEVIRQGKILLLRDKQSMPVEYPLEKLSREDQFYAKSVAQAAKAAATATDK